MQVLDGVIANIALLLQCIVVEAVAVLCTIFRVVNHLGEVYHLEVVLIFSPYRVLGKLLILFGTDAYLQLAHVASLKDVLTAEDEVLGAKSHIAVRFGVDAMHNQVQCLQAGASLECLVGDCYRHAGVHL